jgi:hypothetical protein
MPFDQAAIGFYGSWAVSEGANEPIRAARYQATKNQSQFRISRRLCPAATSSAFMASGCSEQVIAPKSPVRLHVPDHRLDRRPASQLAPDRGREPPPLSRDEHPIRLGVVVSAIALVDVDARGLHVRHGDDLADGIVQRMAVIRIAFQRFGREDEALPVRHRHSHLGTKLIRPMRLALGDAHHLWSVKAVELVLARAFLRQKTLDEAEQRSKPA